MPQPKRSTSSRARAGAAKKSSSARKPAARKPAAAARSGTAKKSTAARKPAARKTATAARSGTARKPAARKTATAARSGTARKSTARKSTARKSTARKATAARKPAAARRPAATRAGATGEDALRASVGTLRELLTRGVMLTSERIQEAMDDAVKRGRMTRADAEDMVQNLISAGRKQTEDVISDLEQLIGRGRGVRRAARGRASDGTDRALRQVDKARRAAGLGSFPILRYDDLNASQIAERVSDLTAAQLRKVRDYEKRNANRKSVIGAISRRLG